jgi:hypothetical protein
MTQIITGQSMRAWTLKPLIDPVSRTSRARLMLGCRPTYSPLDVSGWLEPAIDFDDGSTLFVPMRKFGLNVAKPPQERNVWPRTAPAQPRSE